MRAAAKLGENESSFEKDLEETIQEQLDQSATAVPQRNEPVELPSADIDLDAAFEAEIEAAMAADLSAVDDRREASDDESADSARVLDGSADDIPEEGSRRKGTVQSLHGDNVFVELGYRAPAIVSLRQFESKTLPKIGQEIEVVINRVDPVDGLILASLPGEALRIAGNWDAVESGQIVECMVQKTNKGGLEVQVGTLRGFLPAGQVDLQHVGDLEPFVGQKLRVKIIEANPQKRNLVVSRRALLAEERERAEETFWEAVTTDQEYTGTVKKLMDYGAFVDLGGTDGFLHIGQISWTRINHPSEVLQEGDEVRVKVVSIDRDKKRIGLSLRQLTDNPWSTAVERYAVGTTASGTVVRLMDFGAFVELEPGVEGLIHISELDYKRVKRVADVLSEGQDIDVQVLSVDLERRRIGLSLKALLEKPPTEQEARELAEAEAADEPVEPIKRKHTGPLKGGLGSGSGLLFGDPDAFSR